MITVYPGAYEGISFEEYRSWDALNHSTLRHMKRSPQHCAWAKIASESDATPALALGNLVDCLLLEPQEFSRKYVVGIDGDGRTKEIKAAREKLEAVRGDRAIVKPSDLKVADAIAASLLSNDKAADYIRTSKLALSVVWDDEATGLRCKARIDLYNEKMGLVGDLKTTSDASPESFARSIYAYDYLTQAAMYRNAVTACGMPWSHHLFLTVETEAPYCAALYRLADELIDLGAMENARLMRQYATCSVRGEWPGYPTNIVDIGIPSWAAKQLEEKNGIA